MKNIQKIVALFLLLSGIVFIGIRAYFYFTDGFQKNHIVSHIPADSKWNVHRLSASENAEVQQALNQTFTYLAKGHQAYVFISEDQKYVIKFLKFHRNRLQPWMAYLPDFPLQLKEYKQARYSFKKERMEKVLESWKTAFDDLQKENGLLVVQINPSQNTFSQLRIIDKIGRSYQVDLDQTTFLLQKKAELICPEIDACMKTNQIQLAQKRIDQFLTLFLSEYKKGLAETDHHVLRNTGFLQGEAIHIDAGRFDKNPKYLQTPIQLKEIQKKTAELREWLINTHPSLVDYLDQKIK